MLDGKVNIGGIYLEDKVGMTALPRAEHCLGEQRIEI